MHLFSRVSYDRVDEIIWVKTNQLQRIIRTGRTGHWLNHGKEHCLVCLSSSSVQYPPLILYILVLRNLFFHFFLPTFCMFREAW